MSSTPVSDRDAVLDAATAGSDDTERRVCRQSAAIIWERRECHDRQLQFSMDGLIFYATVCMKRWWRRQLSALQSAVTQFEQRRVGRTGAGLVSGGHCRYIAYPSICRPDDASFAGGRDWQMVLRVRVSGASGALILHADAGDDVCFSLRVLPLNSPCTAYGGDIYAVTISKLTQHTVLSSKANGVTTTRRAVVCTSRTALCC